MRKAIGILALGLIGLTACTQQQPTVFGNTAQEFVSVAQVKTLYDDSHVKLTGYIVEQIGKEDYKFQDLNGDTILVEIDDHVWNGLNLSSKDKINIYGKLDKEFSKLEIEVYQIEKAQ